MIDPFEANALVPAQPLPEVQARGMRLARELASAGRSRRRRALRAVAIAVAVAVPATIALAETDVPSPFRALNAADRPITAGDAIDPTMRAKLELGNADRARLAAQGWPATTLELDQARLVITTTDGSKLFVIPTADGKLCVLLEHGGDLGEGSDACLEPLDDGRPISGVFEGPTPGRAADLYGVAVDGVVAVDGTSNGLPISIPVHDNAYLWQAPNPWTGRRVSKWSRRERPT